jgi:hypothetical protein
MPLGLKWFTKNRENLAGGLIDERQEAVALFPSSLEIFDSPIRGLSHG